MTAFQGIGLRAAEGDEKACDQLLRLVDSFHDMLQPTAPDNVVVWDVDGAAIQL